MIYSDQVLNFFYEKLLPQLKKYNFNIILRMKINGHEIIGRLLEINEFNYMATIELINSEITQVKILRISEMEIAGNANNSDEWRHEFAKAMHHE